jgi:hypothetical protein
VTTGAPVVINATIFDNTGTQIGLQAIAMPPNGHIAFISAERFPVTAGRRGLIQFQNTAGGTIAAVGLRFSPSGSFTSVPVAAQ